MNSNKVYKLLTIIITVVLTFMMYSTCYADSEKITKDFEMSSCYSFNNEVIYGIYIVKDGENISLSIKATDYNLPSNLYDYKDEIRLRITYSEEDYKLYDCKVINYKTGELIDNLSEENMNKLFDIEYGKDIVEKLWSDKIKLSELKENMIYKYTANATIQFPKIENDIGKNCILYIKEKDDENYNKKINMAKEIIGNGISVSFNEYNSGESFCIMYKTLENSELLDLIGKDEIIYLSKYKDGDELEYQLEKYIYNDTERNISINVKDIAFGIEYSNSVVIGKGEICGFDWMIDSAIISYSEDNNNDSNQTIVDASKKIENNKDNTVEKPSKLLQVGIVIIIFVIILSSIIVIIFMIKLRKSKDIKYSNK